MKLNYFEPGAERIGYAFARVRFSCGFHGVQQSPLFRTKSRIEAKLVFHFSLSRRIGKLILRGASGCSYRCGCDRVTRKRHGDEFHLGERNPRFRKNLTPTSRPYRRLTEFPNFPSNFEQNVGTFCSLAQLMNAFFCSQNRITVSFGRFIYKTG